jgi:hypothetical protein
MLTICEPRLKRGQVAYPCTCCGSPVEREEVYCPRCLQAIRAGLPGSERFVPRVRTIVRVELLRAA